MTGRGTYKFLLTLRKNCGIIPVVQVYRWNSSTQYASVAQSVEQLIRNQQVRCSSHPTSSTGRPGNGCFRGVLLCKKFLFSEGVKLETHTVTHTAQKTQRTGREVRLPNRCAVCIPLRPLSHLRHEAPHGLGRLVLFLAGGVGVGPQGEPCVVVPQHGGDRFDVYPVLEGQGGKGVA